MSIPESKYKNQKCACFIELERLEAERDFWKSKAEKLAEALRDILSPKHITGRSTIAKEALAEFEKGK